MTSPNIDTKQTNTALPAKRFPTYLKITLAVCILIVSIFTQAYFTKTQIDYDNFVAENVVAKAEVNTFAGDAENNGNIVTVQYIVEGKAYSYNAKKSLLNPSLKEGSTIDVVYPEHSPVEAQQVDRFSNGGVFWKGLSLFVCMMSTFFIVRTVISTVKAKKAKSLKS